jgi:cellulose synthase/poly-beta-1,6-N-acetylglucosamine synthase-like glycosyltransferase
MTEILFWILSGILIYVFIGYPVLLALLAQTQKKLPPQVQEALPKIALIISAYNEEEVITGKLQNSLDIDYPPDLKEIWVISDESSDRTDEIVRSFSGQGVRLFRVEGRRGKTHGISLLVPRLVAEIIVFSDANAIYDRNALREIVSGFANQKVGYVVGHARYYSDGAEAQGNKETTYWNFEIGIKKLESRLDSVVGGDGAIYAIRRELFEPMADDDINDFVNPLQIRLKGYRGLFNERAFCYEHSAENMLKEFKRKRRIVNRSWRGLFKNSAVLNPLRTGIFSWQIFSHKLLRWLAGIILLLILITNVLLSGRPVYDFFLLMQTAFYLLAALGIQAETRGRKSVLLFAIPAYFVLVNIASTLGIIDNLLGKKYTTWNTIRQNQEE